MSWPVPWRTNKRLPRGGPSVRAEDILSRFDDVSDQPDGGYLARCPGHGDSRPSLRIWFGDDGRVRMTCRAGCATADVISKVGLCWADMFGASGQTATVSSKRPETVGTAEIAALRVYLDQASDNYGLSPAASYALERFGVDGDLASLVGLGYDDGSLPGLPYRSRGFRQFPRLIVPLVGFDGVARGLQGRDISGDCPARWMSLSNPEGLRWSQYGYFPCDSDTVLVTEG